MNTFRMRFKLYKFDADLTQIIRMLNARLGNNVFFGLKGKDIDNY